jgi:hypothetical protein
MRLPARADGSGVEIGISDILAWRLCPARAKFGRRRLEGRMAPESQSAAAAYGTAAHTMIERLEEGDTIDEAVQAAFEEQRQWLEPGDLTLLREDGEKYLERQIVGTRTLLSEGEISIPLFEHEEQGQVWFRGRIDRLVQSLDDPGHLIHTDYKSSRWAKSHEEVAADLQLWSYNLLIYEWFTDLYPEVDSVRLQQVYDQLRYGTIPTQKSTPQRQEIRRWLVTAITAMIADEDEAPTYNEWCPWCALKPSCPVVRNELTDWALVRIAALMPRADRFNKDGNLSKRPGPVRLDEGRLEEYVEALPKVKRAAATLQAFDDELTKVLKAMPDSSLADIGKRKAERSKRVFSEAAKRQIVEELGLPIALQLFDLSIAELERFFQGDEETIARLSALSEKRPAYTVVVDL